MLAGAAPFRPPPPAVRERCMRACPRPFPPVTESARAQIKKDTNITSKPYAGAYDFQKKAQYFLRMYPENVLVSDTLPISSNWPVLRWARP